MGALGRLNQQIEMTRGAEDFLHVARIFAAARGRHGDAIALAKQSDAPSRVLEILQRASPGQIGDGGTSPGGWGADLAPFANVATAWLESLRQVSVFDAMLPSMRRVPLQQQLIVVTAGAIAGKVAETEFKPVSQLTLTNSPIEVRKCVAILAGSDELFKIASPSAAQLFNTELQRAVAAATDADFLGELYTNATPTASAGDPLSDLGALLSAISTSANSKLFFIIDNRGKIPRRRQRRRRVDVSQRRARRRRDRHRADCSG
jgi:hypothetical protein